MKTFETSIGEVTVKDAMIDLDGTNLEEGIVIRLEDESTIEILGFNEDSIDKDTVESLVGTYC